MGYLDTEDNVTEAIWEALQGRISRMIDLKIEEVEGNSEINMHDHAIDIMDIVSNNLDMSEFASEIRDEVSEVIGNASISIDV
tara:strand:+ start:3316 stop:3564 length:249 start_codon:yes stop_codon:yes gene_type:complete